MANLDDQWNLTNIPPKGHKDVADFAGHLFDIAKQEKQRLHKHEDFLANYALYRGKESTSNQTAVRAAYTPVNLYFANIERTVSNITARKPVGEVVDLDGIDDDGEQILTTQLKKWWENTNQQAKTRASARSMEIFGITIEKPAWDKKKQRPDVQIVDPFTFFPAPGNYEDISSEAPYICFVYPQRVDAVENKYGVKDVAEDEAYELLGTEREKYKADNYNAVKQRIGNYEDTMYRVKQGDKSPSERKMARCLVIEVWVRDAGTRTKRSHTPILQENGMPSFDLKGYPLYNEIRTKDPVYPDGVRKITIVKKKPKSKSQGRSEYMVLDDSANPNVNPRLDPRLARTSHPWGRLPVYIANSYKDLVSIWGFAAAEQVGDLIHKINQIITKLMAYVINVMAPPLIVQKHCGISRAMIESELTRGGQLILMPTTPNARIEFMQVPNVPQSFFQMLDLIIKLFDRVYQIEDADRGEAPKGVIAASAIVALQERNQVLMQSKTTSIDSLAEHRSRWAIGLWQNYGTREELVEVGEEPRLFVGKNFLGRSFSYVVEAGSTTPRTSLQVQEMAQALYQMQAIDRRALLETLNFPKWKEIEARLASGQLQQILEVLVEEGRLLEEEAMNLMAIIEGREAEAEEAPAQSREVKPAGPKSGQGQQPPAEVRGTS